MTWFNDLWKKSTKKTSFETKPRKQTINSEIKERSALLNKTNAIRKNITPFLVSYSPTLPNIREIINKHWHILNINNSGKQKCVILHESQSLSQIFREWLMVISHRKTNNFKDNSRNLCRNLENFYSNVSKIPKF